MSTPAVGESTSGTPTGTADLKLEVVVFPVSDVDRAKEFYGGLGWRLDADISVGESVRVVQFTPPGSGCSLHVGKNVTSAAPGSGKAFLVVSDIEAAHAQLAPRRIAPATARTRRSEIRTATSGSCRK
jgi:catechol 2,3-dioxygenase-like lactoylglutathione lyase family enzyme